MIALFNFIVHGISYNSLWQEIQKGSSKVFQTSSSYGISALTLDFLSPIQSVHLSANNITNLLHCQL